jgi:hypothetical protein
MRFSFKSLLAAIAVAATMALAAAPAEAGNWRDCQGKIARAVDRYEAAVDRYGPRSDRAYKERYKVREIKRKCYEAYGRRWDPRGDRYNRDDDWRGDY